MSVPTILENRLSSLRDSVNQNMKGGEKEMVSEWEKLEKLSKDELIIELVKERHERRIIDYRLRSILELDYPVDRQIPVYCEEEDLSEGSTSDDWAYRVSLYAYEQWDDKDDFDPFCAMAYGLDEEQSVEAYRKMRVNGIITDSSNDLEGWF